MTPSDILGKWFCDTERSRFAFNVSAVLAEVLYYEFLSDGTFFESVTRARGTCAFEDRAVIATLSSIQGYPVEGKDLRFAVSEDGSFLQTAMPVRGGGFEDWFFVREESRTIDPADRDQPKSKYKIRVLNPRSQTDFFPQVIYAEECPRVGDVVRVGEDSCTVWDVAEISDPGSVPMFVMLQVRG